MINSRRLGRKFLVCLGIGLAVLIASSCNGSAQSDKSVTGEQTVNDNNTPTIKLINIDSPSANQEVTSGLSVKLGISLLGKEIPDSIRVYFDGELKTTLMKGALTYSIPTKDTRLGRIAIKAIAYSENNRPHTVTRFVVIFSDIVPKNLSYSIVNEYPHDRGAYTQGLLYHNGFFYESTGPEGKSTLREVEPVTGVVKRVHKLESKFFGEGLVLFSNQLYQLTWEHKTGFIYDLETFKEIRRFHYDTEGWGLATSGEKIFMSDGTNKIYFLEPEYFTVTGSIEVYDDKTAVYQLNELEYIDGELWANIYMTNLIARIDPVTGKVLSYINFQGILKEEAANLTNQEVLNGIAWDPDQRRLFITGKNWPKLFEIKVR